MSPTAGCNCGNQSSGEPAFESNFDLIPGPTQPLATFEKGPAIPQSRSTLRPPNSTITHRREQHCTEFHLACRLPELSPSIDKPSSAAFTATRLVDFPGHANVTRNSRVQIIHGFTELLHLELVQDTASPKEGKSCELLRWDASPSWHFLSPCFPHAARRWWVPRQIHQLLQVPPCRQSMCHWLPARVLCPDNSLDTISTPERSNRGRATNSCCRRRRPWLRAR